MPYAALILHGKKKFESRTKAILRQYQGRYIALHVSAQAATCRQMGSPTAQQIARAAGLRKRALCLPAGLRKGQVVAIIKIGSTRRTTVPRTCVWPGYTSLNRRVRVAGWTKHIFAGKGRQWERRIFVAANRIGTCFMSKIEEVHVLETPVCIERGYVFVHTVTVGSAAIPEGVDTALLLKCHEMETVRAARLKHHS